MTTLIHGFAISNFRSFGDKPQYLGPFSQMNVFIGENNSGKSNVLRFLKKAYARLSNRQAPSFQNIHDTRRGQGTPISFPILVPIDGNTMAIKFPQAARVGVESELIDFLSHLSIRAAPTGYAWVELLSDGSVNTSRYFTGNKEDTRRHAQARRLWGLLRNANGGDAAYWYDQICAQVIPSLIDAVNPTIVPTLRRISSRLEAYRDEYGETSEDSAKIIDDLAVLAQPTHDRSSDKERFNAIQDFMRRVLKRTDISLEIPHDRKTINVRDHGRYVPIEALGTGVHQLLILAIRAISQERSVVCIEEPELHFHPELQHQLMHFLKHETSNQYFITTHSASIMDSVESEVFSVILSEEKDSLVDRPLQRSHRREICHALGYRPSDLLQANSIIWVEGPSDRVYLLNWLASIDKELEEGWHFAIMFYGGRLLSNLSAAETTVDDFIGLLPINRFATIILDSDKRTERSGVNATKTRVITEFSEGRRHSWLTQGREIENYVERAIRERAIQEVHGKDCTLLDADDSYGHPLAYQKSGNKEGIIDKLAVARAACNTTLSVDVMDLRKQLDLLVGYIRKANRI